MSSLHDIISLQAQLRECEQESQHLIGLLTSNLTLSSISSMSEGSLPQQQHTTPIENMEIIMPTTESVNSEPSRDDLITQPESANVSSSENILSDISMDLDTISVCTNSSATTLVTPNTSSTYVNSNPSSPTSTTVKTVEPSTSLQECTIDKTLENMKNCLYLDDFRLKHDGDFRFILQNPRGIKEFRNDNPEYLPTMQALKRGTK